MQKRQTKDTKVYGFGVGHKTNTLLWDHPNIVNLNYLISTKQAFLKKHERQPGFSMAFLHLPVFRGTEPLEVVQLQELRHTLGPGHPQVIGGQVQRKSTCGASAVNEWDALMDEKDHRFFEEKEGVNAWEKQGKTRDFGEMRWIILLVEL